MNDIIKGAGIYAVKCNIYSVVEAIDEDIGDEAIKSGMDKIIPSVIDSFKARITENLKAVYLLAGEELINIIENLNFDTTNIDIEDLKLFFVSNNVVDYPDSGFMDMSADIDLSGGILTAFFRESETGSYVYQGYDCGEYDTGYMSEFENEGEDSESLGDYMIGDGTNDDINETMEKLEE